METIEFSKIGAEDLNIGSGTFTVQLSDGRQATLTQINLTTFVTSGVTDTNVFFTDGEDVGQESNFTFDKTTDTLTVGVGGSIVSGSATASSDEFHAAADGQVSIKIENTAATVGDAQLIFTKQASDVWNISMDDSDSDKLIVSTGTNPNATPNMVFITGGSNVLIGTATVATSNDAGLVINQRAFDDEILTLQSSDVAHGITGETQTSTYGFISKASGSNGGMRISGYTEDEIGTNIRGTSTVAVTTTSTGATGAIQLDAQFRSGTSVTGFAANDNIVVITDNQTARFIFKGDGDLELDGSANSTSFDTHDDIQLLEAVKTIGCPDHRKSLGDWVDSHLDILEAGNVITRHENGWFYSLQGMQGLLIDSIRQLAGRVKELEGA